MLGNSTSDLDTVPVLYDETRRRKSYREPQVWALASSPTLLGHLQCDEHGIEGNFPICLGAGNVTLVSLSLYNFLPVLHRPALDTSKFGTIVKFNMLGRTLEALGSLVIPVIFIDENTGKKFCVKLHALLVEHLRLPMFIGKGGVGFVETEHWVNGKVTYEMGFGNGVRAKVVYRP